MPEWIRKALEVLYLHIGGFRVLIHMKANDIYTVTESKIPYVAHLPAADPDAPPQKRYHDCRITAAERMRPDQPNTVSTAHRFTKADLRGAQVIEQVDHKFVACVVAGAVVLIDQHAADERVRVERFLKELCLGYLGAVHSDGQERVGVRVRELHPPVPVLLSRDEERQTRDPAVRRAFGCWGFRFKGNNKSPLMEEGVEGTSDAGNPSGYSQVFVECVPEVVANKVYSPRSVWGLTFIGCI
jgi:DNA mismatch repair protein MLH3